MAKKKPAKLDRSRPYGTIHGGSKGAFEQDGKIFDSIENEIIENAVVDSEPVADSEPAEPVVDSDSVNGE